MTGQKVLQVVILRDGLLVGTEVFVPGTYVVGSSEDADLRLDDPTVQARHGALYFQNGKVAVQDYGAPGGVYVNGHRVKACEVRPVDEVSFGPFSLKMRPVAEQSSALGAPPPEVANLLEGPTTPATARPAPASPHTGTALSARKLAAAAAQPATVQEKRTVPHLRAATPPPFSNAEITSQFDAVPARPPVQLRTVEPPEEETTFSGGIEVPEQWRSSAPGAGPHLSADDPVGRHPQLFLELYWKGQRAEAKSFKRLSTKKPLWAAPRDDAPMPLYGFRLPDDQFVLADQVGDHYRLFVPHGASVERREHGQFVPVPPTELQQENGRYFVSLAKGMAARLVEGQMSLVAYVQPPLKRPFVNPLAGLPFLALFLVMLFGGGAGTFVWMTPKPQPTADFQHKNLPPVAIRLIAPPPKAKEQAKQKLAELAAKAEARKQKDAPTAKPSPKVKPKSVPQAPANKALAALSRLSAAGPASKDIFAAVDKMGSGPGAKNSKRNDLSGLLGKGPVANAGIGTFGLGGGGKGGFGTKGAEILKGKGGAGIGGLGAGSVGRGAVGGTVARATARTVAAQGSIDREAVAKVLNDHVQEIRACYERALLKDPGLAGKVVLEWTIAGNGGVSSVKTKSSTLRNASVEGCILSNLKRWRFPSPKGGMVIVSYPFVFNSVGY